MIEPMKQGALARVIENTVNLCNPAIAVPKGAEFIVDDYVSDADAEDGVGFYWGNWHGGYGNLAVAGFKVEQVKSAEEMAARRIPLPQEVAKQIGHHLMLGSYEGFDVFEVEGATDREVELYGRTNDGLSFGFRVRVEAVWQVSD
jgi:hypothetical protein